MVVCPNIVVRPEILLHRVQTEGGYDGPPMQDDGRSIILVHP